jgi:hypothetical protein
LQKLKKPNTKQILIIAAISSTIAFVFLFRYVNEPAKLLNILPHLITATSIIAAIIIGYLVNRFFSIRRTRYDKLSRFAELQEELQPYQAAFLNLADFLAKKYKVDPQYTTRYNDLLRDETFWRDKSKKPYAAVFIRNLYQVGVHHWDYADYESRHWLMSPEELDAIDENLESLSSTLCREKYYKHVFSDLGLPLQSDFSQVAIADDKTNGWLKGYTDNLAYEHEYQWYTLGYWELKINKALNIVKRMLGNASFVFSYAAGSLKTLFRELVIVMIFGLFLPLVILGFHLPAYVANYLSYTSLAGFITSFVIVVITIYREISSKKITTID